MATWPSDFPAHLINQYSEAKQDIALRSTMEKGPAKVRRRFTAAVTNAQLGMILTTAQVATLEAFYETNAALAFDFTHPRTGATVEARFTQPPRVSDLNGQHYTVQVNIEYLP